MVRRTSVDCRYPRDSSYWIAVEYPRILHANLLEISLWTLHDANTKGHPAQIPYGSQIVDTVRNYGHLVYGMVCAADKLIRITLKRS